MSMWGDLQETFFILYGPLIYSLLLPVFVGSGIVVALYMAIDRFWRPKEKIQVEVVRPDEEKP